MEMDHAALTLLYITVKPCSWLPEVGQQRQSTFSGSKCYLGLFVRHLSDEEVQRTCYMKNRNTQLSFFVWGKPPNTLNSVWLFGKCGTYPSSKLGQWLIPLRNCSDFSLRPYTLWKFQGLERLRNAISKKKKFKNILWLLLFSYYLSLVPDLVKRLFLKLKEYVITIS